MSAWQRPVPDTIEHYRWDTSRNFQPLQERLGPTPERHHPWQQAWQKAGHRHGLPASLRPHRRLWRRLSVPAACEFRPMAWLLRLQLDHVRGETTIKLYYTRHEHADRCSHSHARLSHSLATVAADAFLTHALTPVVANGLTVLCPGGCDTASRCASCSRPEVFCWPSVYHNHRLQRCGRARATLHGELPEAHAPERSVRGQDRTVPRAGCDHCSQLLGRKQRLLSIQWAHHYLRLRV